MESRIIYTIFWLLTFILSALGITKVVESELHDIQFNHELLKSPRINSSDLTGKFSYTEIETFIADGDSILILLSNGYASAKIENNDNYYLNHDEYRIKRIDIVFTKYPYHKHDWLTNYYDLLSWRLDALFKLDPNLNDPAIEWGLVLQTSGKTAIDAKNLFHGIAIYLEPILRNAEDKLPPVDKPEPDPNSIQNGGFLTREIRNPDYFRSPILFVPEPGQELRRNMDPKKLRCPSWR